MVVLTTRQLQVILTVCISKIRSIIYQTADENTYENDSPFQTGDRTIPNVFARLEETSARFLISSSPIKSSSRLPTMPLAIVSPIKRARFHCNISSKSTQEKKLEETVKKLTKQVTTLKEHVSALQATVILQGRYCDRVRRHLKTQEKKGCREGDNVKLNGDGMPRLLTSDEVFEQVLRQQAKAAEKETRKAAQMVRIREMELWMQEDEARKNRNKAKTEQWKVAVKEWEVEQRLAKQEK
ncbi:hypothetical protein C8R48DRAFT_617730 [Suillus tomentosus]|nr:hypothetical protein C8R48DRAFT_617730 [Suillus tomentosus]